MSTCLVYKVLDFNLDWGRHFAARNDVNDDVCGGKYWALFHRRLRSGCEAFGEGKGVAIKIAFVCDHLIQYHQVRTRVLCE